MQEGAAIAQKICCKLDLSECAVLARLHMVDLRRGPEAAVMVKHETRFDFVAVNLGYLLDPCTNLNGK